MHAGAVKRGTLATLRPGAVWSRCPGHAAAMATVRVLSTFLVALPPRAYASPVSRTPTVRAVRASSPPGGAVRFGWPNAPAQRTASGPTSPSATVGASAWAAWSTVIASSPTAPPGCASQRLRAAWRAPAMATTTAIPRGETVARSPLAGAPRHPVNVTMTAAFGCARSIHGDASTAGPTPTVGSEEPASVVDALPC